MRNWIAWKIRRHDNKRRVQDSFFLCSIFLVACWCLHKTFQCQQLYDESKSRALHIISIFHSPLNIFPHDRMFSIGCWVFCLYCCVVSYLRWMEKTTSDGWVHWWVKRAGRKEQRQKNAEKNNNLYILSCCTTVLYTTPPSHVTCGASKNQNNNFFLTLSAALGEFISKLKYSTDQRCLFFCWKSEKKNYSFCEFFFSFFCFFQWLTWLRSWEEHKNLSKFRANAPSIQRSTEQSSAYTKNRCKESRVWRKFMNSREFSGCCSWVRYTVCCT